MTIPSELEPVLVAEPEYLSGAVRFRNTRIPVQALLDTLIGGHDVEYFLEGFPGVTREQAEAVIRYGQNQLRRILELELV